MINIEEAAKLLDRSVGTVYHLMRSNTIPFKNQWKRLYFLRSELLDWLNNEDGSRHKPGDEDLVIVRKH